MALDHMEFRETSSQKLEQQGGGSGAESLLQKSVTDTISAVTGLSTVPLCIRSLALASVSKSGRDCVSHRAVLHCN